MKMELIKLESIHIIKLEINNTDVWKLNNTCDTCDVR